MERVKSKFEKVFVVLTYRSCLDLEDCLRSIGENYKSFKVVVVNSYFDHDSEEQIKNVANKYCADFISVENRGYSYGNNMGIEYCKQNFEFDFLIICNPDTIVEKDSFNYEEHIESQAVFAPTIHNLSNKQQNPYWAIDNKLCEYLIYWCYKNQKRYLLYFPLAINKFIRIAYNLLLNSPIRSSGKIYACHGSFVIYSKGVIEDIDRIYDDNMFLFSEEAYTARVFKERGIHIYLTREIRILHKEDGSMKISNINEFSELRKSVLYYYEKTRRMKRNAN